MHPVIFEAFAFAMIALLIVTQAILPAVRNEPMFPWFRFRRLFKRLDDAKAVRVARSIEADIRRERLRAVEKEKAE